MNPTPDPAPAPTLRLSPTEWIPLLLVYLYAVSVCYYQGYWGTLGLDVFNYYAVQDLAKGVVQPLASAVWLTSLTLVSALLLQLMWLNAYPSLLATNTKAKSVLSRLSDFCFTWLQSNAPRLSRTASFILSILAGLAVLAALLYFQATWVTDNLRTTGGRNTETIVFCIAVLALWVSSQLPPASVGRAILRLIITSFFFSLPCTAYLKGRSRAANALKGAKTDYLSPPLPTPPGVYKYLGKAGDYHFLLSRDNKRRFIIPASQLVPLELRQDTASFPDSLLHPQRRRVVPPRAPAQQPAPLKGQP